MDRQFEDVFSSMNNIYDYSNVRHIFYLHCPIDFVFNNKEFNLCWWYVHCMINSFCDNFMFSSNMWDWDSNIVSNTCVRNDKYSILIVEWLFI